MTETGAGSLRILLSAYACEPDKGSEPGVGWGWALTLAQRGHHVWVITRANNREPIERALAGRSGLVRNNLHFIYYDLPAWTRWWKKGNRGVHLYYLLWQLAAYRLAKHWRARVSFDVVHHVTFVSARQPSFMGNLGIPFIFGPVAGGERAALRLRRGYSFHGWLQDSLRDLANGLICFDPFMRCTFAQAERIYVTSEQTRRLVPHRHRDKATLQLAIAMEATGETGSRQVSLPKATASGLRVLYVGQFVSLKGMHLGIRAFGQLLKVFPNARLTMAGNGREKENWRHLASRVGIDGRIDWHPWMPRTDLARLYREHDVFLFPSLHDSGGMVVLEAMAHGLPVVCLKLGGPGLIVDETCGRAIEVDGASAPEVVQRLAAALIDLATHPEVIRKLGAGAIARGRLHSWDRLVDRIYGPIEQAHQPDKWCT